MKQNRSKQSPSSKAGVVLGDALASEIEMVNGPCYSKFKVVQICLKKRST